MARLYERKTYGAPPKHILAIPDHYVSLAHTFRMHTTENPNPLAVEEDGRWIIKAGTFYPANDETAVAIVFNEVDVTRTDVDGALLYHGFVKEAALPEPPAETVNLPQITFVKPVSEQ